MKTLKKQILFISFLAGIIFVQRANAQSSEAIVGNIRIQALSKNLIRIEQRGPNGFEDRNTFTVVNRNWPGETINIQEQDSQTVLVTSQCEIDLPRNCHSLEGICIHLKNGKSQYRFKGIPPRDFLPGPVSDDQLWILSDSPRLVPLNGVLHRRLNNSRINRLPAGIPRIMQRMYTSFSLNRDTMIDFGATFSNLQDRHLCLHSMRLVCGTAGITPIRKRRRFKRLIPIEANTYRWICLS